MKNIKNIVNIALMCAICTICSGICVPLPSGIPITLQTFAVSAIGFILPRKEALLCYTIYLFLGICGIPVFSGFTSGIYRLFDITGGFLWGFYFLIFIASYARDKSKIFCFISSVFAVLICHLCGIFQFFIILKTSFLNSFYAVSAPFILKDILSYIFAYFLYKRLKRGGLKCQENQER